MKRMADFGEKENLADAMALATLLKTLYRLPKPTIARVHGAAYGGGVGLVACCDIALAAQQATFALTEAKLGLIPATIGPYVVEAIGARAARRYFLTGERFDAEAALRIGLVHEIAEDLDGAAGRVVDHLLAAGPEAVRAAKRLIRERPLGEATAHIAAALRTGPEGQEGLRAFLEKRAATLPGGAAWGVYSGSQEAG
jgi:methylglutaconyl-CoA hydratase